MPKLNLAERLIDPRTPDRRPRRAAYALPTMFTAGNVLLGFLSIIETFQGAMSNVTGQSAEALHHFDLAAIMIGIAAVMDGLDGRIARMTNTVSDFGREIDSLADAVRSRAALAHDAGSAPVRESVPRKHWLLNEALHRSPQERHVLKLSVFHEIFLMDELFAWRKKGPAW